MDDEDSGSDSDGVDGPGGGDKPPPPSVFDFLDLKRFLVAWRDWKREVLPWWSYQMLADKAKLARATFPNIISGRKRVSAETLRRLGIAMGLRGEELDYLEMLRLVAVAANLRKTGLAIQSALAHPRCTAGKHLDRGLVAVLSHWTYLAVLELCNGPGFLGDAARIARILDPLESGRAARGDLESVLSTLEAVGLIERIPGGFKTTSQEALTALQAGPSMAAHVSALELARDKLYEVDQAQRMYFFSTIRVPPGAFHALRRQIWDQVGHWVALGDADPSDDDDLHFLQVQLFPFAGPRTDDGSAPPTDEGE